jgi:DNA-directed RNA polymerase subunit beta
MEISPKQVLSVSASCIPFIESDDGVRALYGTNMQRQALPLINPISPCVGTGNEFKVALDSGLALTYNDDTSGKVTDVSSEGITVKNSSGSSRRYNLVKYRRSNQETCINQIPLVSVGDTVKQNQIIADGPAMNNGELSLGRNLLVAFTT